MASPMASSASTISGVGRKPTTCSASGLAMRASSDSLPEWVASEDPSMIKAFAPLALLLSLLSFHLSDAMADTVPRNVVTELAPSGKLRAAINFGNTVLAQKDPTTGEPRGVSSELARELAKRLAVARASAYDLYLTRALKHAKLVRESSGPEALALFRRDRLEAAAGVKQPIVAFAKEHPDTRVIPGRFMVIEQAMGTPKGREASVRYLREFIEEMKASGFVAKALSASGQTDAAV